MAGSEADPLAVALDNWEVALNYWYHRNEYMVLPDDLIAFAWSAPMRELAAKVGLSDVGLKKLLKGFGVVTPPQGHWNRVHAGRKVSAPPKAPHRRPGENGRVMVDQRFAPFIAQAAPIRADGPFATSEVPEDLEELRKRELKALGRVTVPRTLERHHPGLEDIVKKEQRRREKVVSSSWNWDAPRFDNPVDQRRLKLFNGVLLALAKRGHGGDVSATDTEISARAWIGSTSLGLSLEIAGKHRTVVSHGYRRPDPALPVSTPLVLHVKPGFDREIGDIWQDEDGQRLESRIADITAALIVAGEAKFRKRLREDEERAEQERVERQRKEEEARCQRERRRLERIRELNEQRVTDLRTSGELLRAARDLRALVAEVREAMRDRADLNAETLEAWGSWALQEADALDPILSGQVLKHLWPPELPAPED